MRTRRARKSTSGFFVYGKRAKRHIRPLPRPKPPKRGSVSNERGQSRFVGSNGFAAVATMPSIAHPRTAF
jgi:hypothetical protein